MTPHYYFFQWLQHRDCPEESQGECREALRCCGCPGGTQQDAHRTGALRTKVFQGGKRCILE